MCDEPTTLCRGMQNPLANLHQHYFISYMKEGTADISWISACGYQRIDRVLKSCLCHLRMQEHCSC